MTTLINKLVLVSVGASLLLSLPIGGCHDYDSYQSQSYITEYIVASDINLSYMGSNTVDSTMHTSFMLKFEGKRINGLSKDAELDLYNQLCVKNKDVSYPNEVHTMDGIIGCLAVAVHPNITAINITSNKAFDAAHPAGTSLNEYVVVEYKSYGHFIQNGYSSKGYRCDADIFFNCPNPVPSCLDSLPLITASDMIISEPWMHVIFTRQPEISKLDDKYHTITVVVTLEDGKTLTAKTPVVDFLNGSYIIE